MSKRITTIRVLRIVIPTILLIARANGVAAAGQQQTSPSPAAFPLQADAEQIVAQTNGDWSVLAWSIDRQMPLMAINASEVLAPASNNKVLTSIWALDNLGPDYRFPTDLLIDGPIENGVLKGDVIIRGSGDPAFGYPPPLGYDVIVESPMTPLDKMAQRLQAMGVREVQGDIIGDATAFDDVLVGPAWPNDTGAGAARYAPRVSGLPFQRNMLWVEASAPSGNGAIQVRTDPQVTAVPVVSTVQRGAGNARVMRMPNQDTVRIAGSISGSGPQRYGVGVADPALLTADALRYALTRSGIVVHGVTRTGPTPEGSTVVHRHVSMPLGMMIPFLNRYSDNFFAEHLWKAAAREEVGVGSYQLGGPAAALHFIENAGVSPGEIYQFDGSGLSSQTRVSANTMVRALVYAHQQPYSDVFHSSLAVAGEKGGTMARLFAGTPAAGNLHAKTGFINDVRTLSGYVTSASGELIAFSFLYNGANTSGARGAQTQLGLLLANYGGQ